MNSGVLSTTGDITNSVPSYLTSGSSLTCGTSSYVAWDKSRFSNALE
nr:MAG TPA: hypothetical protein [Caudoviricetes sp.]